MTHPTSLPCFRAGDKQRRESDGSPGRAPGLEGRLVGAQQGVGEDRGAQREAMAVCCPEEDTAGPGCPPAAAEGVPLTAEVVRLLRVRPGHAQGVHQGE